MQHPVGGKKSVFVWIVVGMRWFDLIEKKRMMRSFMIKALQFDEI